MKHILYNLLFFQCAPYSEIQAILRGKNRLEISASLTSTGYFPDGKKIIAEWNFFVCLQYNWYIYTLSLKRSFHSNAEFCSH